VDDCLDLARISERRIQIERRLIDLNLILSASAEALRGRIIEKQLVFSIHLPETPLWVLGDSVRLKQVFMNLLANAVKYTGERGVISIHGSKLEDLAEVEIRDTGVGIPGENLELIFEPFRRGTEEWLRSESSLGIGLAISRQILDIHGGLIRAESAGPGLGSSFRVRLPLAAAGPVEVALDDSRARAAEPAQASRILIVEDSRDAVFLMTVELERAGHSVVAAADGAAGFEMAARECPGMIISDIKMPGMDGYELIRKVRATPAIAHTPAIALTGFGMKADIERALNAGYDACLCKPADPQELIELIDRLIGAAPKPRPASLKPRLTSSGSRSG
jgi:CheY-like chemotaxis protein